MMIEQQQKPSLAYKLKIHALSHYEINIYPTKIDITFVMENYKDMNKQRVKLVQTHSITKQSDEKTISYFRDNDELILCSNRFVPSSIQYMFDSLFKQLYGNIRDIYNKDKILKSLRRQKRNETDKDVISRLLNEIKFHENDKRSYKRNLKNILFPLF